MGNKLSWTKLKWKNTADISDEPNFGCNLFHTKRKYYLTYKDSSFEEYFVKRPDGSEDLWSQTRHLRVQVSF